MGLIVGNVLFFQHYTPISPYFSDLSVNIVTTSLDENAITTTITNKWNDETTVNIEIETNSTILNYWSNCTNLPCSQLDKNIISIKSHESETVKTFFNITKGYTEKKLTKMCIKAVSRMNKWQYGRDCTTIQV